MSNTVPAEIIDLSKLMPLTKAKLQSGVFEYLIAQISPVIVLDCRPIERSYVWMGEGMVDRKPEKMPDLSWLPQATIFPSGLRASYTSEPRHSRRSLS